MNTSRSGESTGLVDFIVVSAGPVGLAMAILLGREGDGLLLRAINWNRLAESGWANTIGFYQPDLEEVFESIAIALPVYAPS